MEITHLCQTFLDSSDLHPVGWQALTQLNPRPLQAPKAYQGPLPFDWTLYLTEQVHAEPIPSWLLVHETNELMHDVPALKLPTTADKADPVPRLECLVQLSNPGRVTCLHCKVVSQLQAITGRYVVLRSIEAREKPSSTLPSVRSYYPGEIVTAVHRNGPWLTVRPSPSEPIQYLNIGTTVAGVRALPGHALELQAGPLVISVLSKPARVVASTQHTRFPMLIHRVLAQVRCS